MEKKIKEFVEKYGLLGGNLIVAVSGGVDSVVLLDLLVRVLPKKNVIVAHVNHGIRKESADEALFVQKIADKYGLSYEYGQLHLAKKDELTAREARYRWLRKIAKKYDAKYIVTAHHLNDQAETVLLNLTRGTGPLEIWGIGECQSGILRPLLSINKQEIVKYARGHKLKYCQDPSNLDARFARNRVRHQIVPELEKINPGLLEAVKREVALGQEINDYLDSVVNNIEKRIVKGNKIELNVLQHLHPYLAKELIKRQLQLHTGKKADIYHKNILAVYDLLNKTGLKETNLGKLNIKKTYKYLVFGEVLKSSEKPQSLILGQTTNFNDFNLRARSGAGTPSKDNVLLPIGFSDNLKVRTWRKGDKIEAKFGTKKIQDVFTDAKIELSERSRWPIITHNNKVVWVPRLIACKEAKKSNKNIIIEVK